MNKTFSSTKFSHNACVGENGVIDFSTYSKGYDKFVRLGLQESNFYEISPDLLVHPLIFCARHRIELFLKDQLLMIGTIKSFLSAGYSYRLNSTHEISTLWNDFKNETNFDKRFIEPIRLIEEYITDFSQIDDTSETFRYPITKGGEKHLKDISVINLDSFKQRYLELSDLLDALEQHTFQIVKEYEQRTFAANLSRKTINEVAKRLPPHKTWSLSSTNFDKIKEDIKIEFSITNTALSNVINVIKNNREFSILIGIELELKELTKSDLVSFIAIYSDFMKETKNNDFNETVVKYTEIIKGKLKKETICCLAEIYDIGYFNFYPESYEDGLTNKLKKENIDDLIRFYLLGNRIVRHEIVRGLKILKQNALLQSINE